MELANPVIGTKVPAPATFAIESYRSKPVKRIDKKTKVMDAQAEAVSRSIPKR